MIPSTSRTTRLLNLVLASYVSLAVLYMTDHFFVAPFSRFLGFHSALPHHLSSRGPLIHWISTHSDVDVTTPKALFLSKTFSASMQPSTTVPFSTTPLAHLISNSRRTM